MATTRELLETLVGIDTTTNTSNLELIQFVEEILDEHGVPHERNLDPGGTKANLIARIGPETEGGVVLSGHTDTVPVLDQPWSRDPFELWEESGRLYGRGTTDMKGFLAVVLAALGEMTAAPLARPILLALTYDEEIGTVGAPSAVGHLLATQPRPSAVVVGEPTSMELVNAHKGVRSFKALVQGVDGHSSQPQFAANAVVAAARIATYIDDLAERHRQEATDTRFTPPYTTFNVATIRGGQAINIVPRACELWWEYRPVPGDDSDEIRRQVETHIREDVLPRLRAMVGSGEIELRPEAVVKALAPEPDSPAERLVREVAGYAGPARTVPFGTDGGHFQAVGLSTVVCGPGSIDQAHVANEWIGLEQLETCERFVRGLVQRLAE